MKKLYFIRHGLSKMNVSGHFAGITDTPLTWKGRRQAKKAGKAAKGLGIDLIVSSPLSRAMDTAKIFAKQIGYPVENIKANSLLVEKNFGTLEGTLWHPDVKYEGTGMETDEEMIKRAHKALAWINTFDADHILIVSHGAFGKALRSIIKEDYPLSHPEGFNNAELVCWIEED